MGVNNNCIRFGCFSKKSFVIIVGQAKQFPSHIFYLDTFEQVTYTWTLEIVKNQQGIAHLTIYSITNKVGSFGRLWVALRKAVWGKLLEK